MPRWLWSAHALGKITAPARPLSFVVRPWCDVPAVATQNQPAFALSRGTRERATALAVSREEAQHASLLRASADTRWLRSVHALGKGHCTGQRPLSFGVRSWCDVPAVATHNQPAFAWHAWAHHCARCLSDGGEAHEIAARASRAALVVVAARTINGHCTGEKPLSIGARPRCDVPAVATQNQPLFASHGTRERATALTVSREEAQHASLMRTRAVPRWLWSAHTLGKGTAPARPLSLGARPWCDVPAVATQNRPAFALSRGTRERATALPVSRDEAQRASLLRADAVTRWLWSVHALGKGTAPARGLSPSACGRGATCQRWPRTISRLSRGTHGRTIALAVSRKEVQHTRLLHARPVPRWLWSLHEP